MEKKKILFISQETHPFLPKSEISENALLSPQLAQSEGKEIRAFMPRYGCINERRHQLHEVIRLSGLNLVINDLDMPLIIKVASIPKERIQVYFIDNEEYFKRKSTFLDSNGKLFEDNDERAIFFAKGVFETIKRLNWSPDIIHVHGWMASLLPLYLKKIYAKDPIFEKTKIITSIYGNEFEEILNKDIVSKIEFDEIEKSNYSELKNPTYENLLKVSANHSDALVIGSNNISKKLKKFLEAYKNPILDFNELDSLDEPYLEFCENLFSK